MELINCDGCSSVILKVSIFSHEIVKRTAINACVISWLRMSGNFPGSPVVKTGAKAGGTGFISDRQVTKNGTTIHPPHPKKEYGVSYDRL